MELMLKVCGVIAILLSGVLIGRNMISSLKKRKKILLEVIEVLTAIKNNFQYRQSDVITAFSKAEEVERECLDLRLDSFTNTSFQEELAVRYDSSTAIKRLLTPRQSGMFREALLGIGAGSLKEECDRLEYYIKYFTDESVSAVETENRNKKVIMALSVYVAVVLSVILI